jgi:clan AA aspartic protease
MGLTTVPVVLKKTHEAKASRTVDFLVDSGAVYSLVQEDVLRSLRIRPHRTRTFYLANGEAVEREIGDAYFEYQGVGGAAPVVFGRSGDKNLLGATTLEALELVLNPFQRELRPLSMSL